MLTFKVGFEVFAVEFVVLHQLDWTSCSSGLMMVPIRLEPSILSRGWGGKVLRSERTLPKPLRT